MRLWKRDNDVAGIESSLRSQRPRLDGSLEGELISRITSGTARRASRYRLALATGMTIAVFAALASFGGVSYAFSAAQNAVSGSNNTQSTWHHDSDDGQYGEDPCVKYFNSHGIQYLNARHYTFAFWQFSVCNGHHDDGGHHQGDE